MTTRMIIGKIGIRVGTMVAETSLSIIMVIKMTIVTGQTIRSIFVEMFFEKSYIGHSVEYKVKVNIPPSR